MRWTSRWWGPHPLLVMTALLLPAVTSAQAQYKVGVGKADMTGPAAEISMMGYASPSQKTAGIHLRQFSRAYVLEYEGTRLVFVTADCGMMSHAVKRQVLKELQAEYGSTYTDSNVMLSGTHTHSAPGGFLQYFLYDITVLGFVKQTFDAYVNGIVKSIQRAHDSVAPARVWVSSGELSGVSVNRSPAAYANNPAEERDRYSADVDTTMVQLGFELIDGGWLGALNWFPLHPTSMNVTNHLVSSDNVGAASLIFEKKMDPSSLPGKSQFNGGFASSNLGDVSPNVNGPRCECSGIPCDEAVGCFTGERCYSTGPGNDMFDSTLIIARKLADKALELLEDKTGAREEVSGPLRVIHQYVDMTNATASVYDEKTNSYTMVKGCLPAMGYSFAAGTRDGPGPTIFKQGVTSENPSWTLVRNLLAKPTATQEACQAPKPILIPSGQLHFPYEWQPSIVPTQLALLGNTVAIACVPAEFTTMSGRRLRDTIKSVLPGVKHVLIAGLCNEYSSYVTTPQEYQVQRYEGASTIYGLHTLPLYLHQYSKLAKALAQNETLEPGPQPPDLSDKQVSLVTPVLFDNRPLGRQYGDVLRQPQDVARPGDVVTACFVSGHPRNDLRQGDTFLAVEMLLADGTWRTVATDASWETRFHWVRTNKALGYSKACITWVVPEDVIFAQYRITHFGNYKYIFGGIYPYKGSTKTFQVMGNTSGS